MKEKQTLQTGLGFIKTGIKQGSMFIGWGLKIMAKVTARDIDSAVNKHPYAFIGAVVAASLIISIYSIGQARAERDSYGKQCYELQQKLNNAVVF